MTTNEGPVIYTVKMDIHEGKLDEFKELGKEIVKDVQDNDPGCTRYDWYLAADGKSLHLMEAYVNSEAVLAHMTNILGPHRERLFAISTITSIYFYSPVSDALKEAVTDFNPVFFESLLGLKWSIIASNFLNHVLNEQLDQIFISKSLLRFSKLAYFRKAIRESQSDI